MKKSSSKPANNLALHDVFSRLPLLCVGTRVPPAPALLIRTMHLTKWQLFWPRNSNRLCEQRHLWLCSQVFCTDGSKEGGRKFERVNKGDFPTRSKSLCAYNSHSTPSPVPKFYTQNFPCIRFTFEIPVHTIQIDVMHRCIQTRNRWRHNHSPKPINPGPNPRPSPKP